MTSPTPKKAPRPRAELEVLLDPYAEGTLAPELASQVAAALKTDTALAAQYVSLKRTLELLRCIPAPAAPSDMLAKVRARLAQEDKGTEDKSTEEQDQRDAAPSPLLSSPASAAHVAGTIAPTAASGAPLPARRWWAHSMELALGACAVAAVVVGLAFGGNQPNTKGPQAAGLSAASPSVVAEFTAPSVSAEQVALLAKQAGLQTEQHKGVTTYAGDLRSARRFVLALRVAASKSNGDVTGLLPAADHVAILVRR